MCKPIPKCYFVKTNINAIPPSKRSCSDEGYDLWLIEIDKKINETTTRYDTCIKIQAGRRMACRNITKKFLCQIRVICYQIVLDNRFFLSVER